MILHCCNIKTATQKSAEKLFKNPTTDLFAPSLVFVTQLFHQTLSGVDGFVRFVNLGLQLSSLRGADLELVAQLGDAVVDFVERLAQLLYARLRFLQVSDDAS